MSDSTLRKSVYEIVTDRILALLDQGTVPWRKPWGGQEQAPRSLATRKPYRGVNVFLLHAAGYESPYWLTYRQAQELGGHIRKGEKGWPVVFWKWREAQDAETDQEGEERSRSAPILRYYTVFNLAQCEKLPADRLPLTEQPTENPFTPIEQAEAVVRGYQSAPRIEHGHAGAWYRPLNRSGGPAQPGTIHQPGRILRHTLPRTDAFHRPPGAPGAEGHHRRNPFRQPVLFPGRAGRRDGRCLPAGPLPFGAGHANRRRIIRTNWDEAYFTQHTLGDQA